MTLRGPRAAALLVAVALLLPGVAGCKAFGGMLVNLGWVKGKPIPAEFTLAPGRLLILVDDDREFVTWSSAGDVLLDEIARHFAKARLETEVLTSSAMRTLQEGDPDFASRSIPEVAKRAGADQVLWIQFVDFFASGAIEEIRGASRCTVRMKVFDPNAASRSQARLWPDDRQGHFETISEGASVLHLNRTDEQIARALIEALADRVAKLFYEHRPEE